MVNIRERDIIEILKKFRERTNILYSILVDNDGLTIAIEQANNINDEDFYMSIGAICSSIVALAENGIDIINENNIFKNIFIQAGDQLDTEGFIIKVESISKDIVLCVIFPSFLNLGVINFELNHTIRKLSVYFSEIEQNYTMEGINTSI